MKTFLKFFLRVLIRLLIPPRIVSNYIKEGFQIILNNFLPVLTMNAFFIVIVSLTYFLLMFVVFQIAYERETQNILLGFLGIPITSFFFCSLIRFHYALVRKSKIKMEILLVDFRKYFHVFLLFTLYYALYNLAFKAIFEFDELDLMNKLRAIAGIGFFFWIVVRLVFSPFFVVEKGYSARKAMKSSFLLTSGRTIKTLVLILLSSGFFLMISSCVGFFVFEVSRTAYRFTKGSSELLLIASWILGFSVLFLFSLVVVSIAFALLNIALVMSYDIFLKNRFSRRKQIVYEAAIETKRKLEDTGFFQALNEDIQEE